MLICLWSSSVLSLLPPAGQQFEIDCDMERYPSGSGHQMMEHCAHEEMDGNKTGCNWAKRKCQRTGCAQKISSTLTASNVVAGQSGAVPSCCLHQTLSSHTNVAPEIVLPTLHCPIFSEPVWMAASACLLSADREQHPVSFTASRSRTLIGTSGYFSCCCLSVVSYQSVRSDPLTLMSPFPPNRCYWPTGYFPLGTILCKHWRCLWQCENPSRWAACRPAASLAPTSTRCDAQFELQEVVFIMSTFFLFYCTEFQQCDAFGWICYRGVELIQHIKWLSNMCAHINYISTTVLHKLWWSRFVDVKERDLCCLLPISAWGHVLQLQCLGFERSWKESIYLRVFFWISVRKLSNLTLFSKQTHKKHNFSSRCI